jgi:cytochrome c peroxidase
LKKQVWLAGTSAITLMMAASALRSGNTDSHVDRQLIPPVAREEIKSVEAEIDRIEDESLNRAQSATLDGFQQNILLGKLIFYDQKLAVNRNQSCAFCHMPETGFTGPVSALNQTTAAYPGSVRTRFKAILLAVSFGTCAPPDCAWIARLPSRPRILRSIR